MKLLMDEFAGKVALITGAGRGAGREVCLAFSSLGVAIAANDINPINLDATVSQVAQAGGVAGAFVFDVAKRMPIEGMVAQVLDHFGKIDILVNHASVEPDVYLLDMDEWEFHRTLDVNLGGPFFCMQQVGRVMRQQGGGTIVNMVSTLGDEQAQKGHSAHFASQAGLVGLTQAAAFELAAYNIRLNAVAYGAKVAWMAPSDWEAAAFQNWRTSLPAAVQQGEHPQLVSLVLFLCSQAASTLTSKVISVSE